METMSKARVVRTIEGLVALCLGETARVVWVNQADAAAFTDGDKIYLPLPRGEDPQEYALMLAIALREVAKAQYCETKAVASAADHVRPYGTVIEEARLKEEIGKPYKGAHEIFQTAFGAVVDILWGHLQGEEARPELAAHAAIWAKAQSSYLKTSVSQAGALRLQEMAISHGVDAAKLDVAMLLATRAATVETTAMSMEIGRKLWSLLQQEQSDSESGSDASQETGDPGEAAAGENAGGDAQSSNTGEGSASDQTGQPDVGQPSSGQTGQEPGEAMNGLQGPAKAPADDNGNSAEAPGANLAPQGSDLLSDALSMLRGFEKSRDISSQASQLGNQVEAPEAGLSEQEIQTIAKALSQESGTVEALLAAVGTTDEDGAESEPVTVVAHGAGGDLATTYGNGANSLLTGVQGRLVTVFQREFQDCTRKPILFKQSGQRVAASQVWKFKRLGSTRIFLPKSQASGIDAAVKILLDRSDSMEADMAEASKVTFALALALQRIAGVQVSIDVFPGVNESSTQFLAFKQNVLRVQKRLEQVVADGGTPMGTALLSSLKQLEVIRCEKKFVLVITDGKPNANELPLTKLMLKKAEADGVTAIGVGIGQAANVDELFSQFIKVGSVNELAWAFETLFKGGLMAKLAA